VKRIVMIVMPVLVGLLVCGATSRSKVSKVKFPASTELCGIRIGDSVQSVWQKYGRPTKPQANLVFDYNDPKKKVNLIVFIDQKKKTADEICMGQGKNSRARTATKPFAHLGHRGIIIDSTKKDVERVFGRFTTMSMETEDQENMRQAYFKVDSPPGDKSCAIKIVFENDKVIEICSRYLASWIVEDIKKEGGWNE